MTYSKSNYSNTFSNNRSKTMIAWVWQYSFQINIATFALLVLLSFVYIIQVNNTASKGYAIRDIENRIHELTLSNQTMELALRDAQSLNNISRTVKMIGLVQENNPTYVDATGATYAFNK